MPGVFLLLLTLIGVAKPESPSVAKCLATARSVAFSLRTDAEEVNKATAVPLKAVQQKQILSDISDAKDTVRELWEMDRIASPSQAAVILRVAPLLRDLARNVEDMSDHVRVHSDELRNEKLRDYLAGHEEIADRLASLIAESIESLTAPVRAPDERE